ncbi:MAG TPA: SUMF1/EgtB/PvdO family nonheme iron enzyme [Rhodothermales bacterium]|nr:SUMF1/EgtB/PvdO family nonheme iron enzyme [Rhodothermales bacterium]
MPHPAHIKNKLIISIFLSCIFGSRLAWSQQTPEVQTIRIEGTVVAFDMVKIPQGQVTIQSGGVSVTRSLDKVLWVSQTEVTWDLFDIFVYGLDLKNTSPSPEVAAVARPSKPYVLPGRIFGHLGFPASAMSYYHANKFTQWLSAKTGKKFRLLTEPEWEYLCAKGRKPNAVVTDEGWVWENSDDKLRKVGTKPTNEVGLSDLLGNVAEWVQSDAEVPFTKGGHYLDDAATVACTARAPQSPEWNMTDPQLPKSRWWLSDASYIGLRLAMEE